jgi:hypothetical protein
MELSPTASVCRIGDSTFANNSAALAVHLKKAAVVVV